MEQEKRKYHRVSVNAVIIYRILDHIKVIKQRLKKIDTPESVDISAGGLQVITSQKLPMDTNMKIDLSILPTKIPLEVYGKVVWMNKDEKSGNYRTGIEFTQFADESQRKLIDKYINAKV